MNELLSAGILGIVEGITEFLPVSSTGHLLIVSKLIGFSTASGTFEVFIQSGALVAVLGFYFRDLFAQTQAVQRDRQVQRFWLGILIAFLPSAAIGVLARDFIKTVLFSSPSLIGWSLLVGGIVMIVVERLPRPAPSTVELTSMSMRQALGIGLAQLLALIPGVSRSGATIIGGMIAGLDRVTATKFSFYLALPTLGAATLYDFAKSLSDLTVHEVGILLLGTLFAAVAAAISIGALLRFVATNTFVPFGIYRIAVGGIVLGLVSVGAL